MGLSYSERASRLRVPLGFALGVAYPVFAQPTLQLLGIGAAIALGGLGIRAWAAGCLDKNRRLATGGPYAYTRNPLYLGSLLLGLGFAAAGGSWPLGVAFLALFLLVYWPVMRREEEFLRRTFADVYDRYAASVPFLFPRRLRSTSADEKGARFQWTRYKHNREYQAALGYLAGVVFLVLKLALR